MLARSYDVGFLNKVLNDPSVLPAVSLGTGKPIDLTDAIFNTANIFLANEFGGFVMFACGGGLYDVHTQFLPAGRGATALKAAHEAASHMFVETDCLALRTFVACVNKPAQRLTKWMGFVPVENEAHLGVDGVTYLLTIKRWVEVFKCQPQL